MRIVNYILNPVRPQRYTHGSLRKKVLKIFMAERLAAKTSWLYSTVFYKSSLNSVYMKGFRLFRCSVTMKILSTFFLES